MGGKAMRRTLKAWDWWEERGLKAEA